MEDTTPLPITADTPLSFDVQNSTPVTPLLNPRQTVSIEDYEELFRGTNTNPQFDFSVNNTIDIEEMD